MDDLALLLASLAFLFFVAGPALTLLHELGHAVAALALTKRRVVVRQGGDPPLVTVRVGRLELRLQPRNSLLFFYYGRVTTHGDEPVPPKRAAVVAVAGPAVSLALAVSFAALTRVAPSWLVSFLTWCLWMELWRLLATVPPIRYGRLFGPYHGMVSDGHRVWHLLRHGKPPQERVAQTRVGGPLPSTGRSRRITGRARDPEDGIASDA